MHSKPLRVVVKDGSSTAFVVNPSQQGDGSLGVYLASIWKFNVTVGPTNEAIGTIGFSIGAWGKSNIPRDSRGISKQTDITSTCSWRQRVHSRGTYRTWKWREYGVLTFNTLFKGSISNVQSTWTNLRGLTGGRAVGRIGGLMGGLTGSRTAEKPIMMHIWCICLRYFEKKVIKL